MSTTENTHAVFNYGSNSTAQLQARLDSPGLSTRRATVTGWSRIFDKYAYMWTGSTASIAACEGGIVHGTVAILSEGEKSKLDIFETGYDEVIVPVTVYNANGRIETIDAVAYVARVPEGHQGIAQPFPSEQYLCAVSGMLREHWPEEIASSITICSVRDGRVVTRGEWMHPNAIGRTVESLQALAIEINLRLNKPWVMPRAARAFDAAIFRQLGVKYAVDVLRIFANEGGGSVAAKLRGDDGFDSKVEEEDLSQALEKVMKAPAQNM